MAGRKRLPENRDSKKDSGEIYHKQRRGIVGKGDLLQTKKVYYRQRRFTVDKEGLLQTKKACYKQRRFIADRKGQDKKQEDTRKG